MKLIINSILLWGIVMGTFLQACTKDISIDENSLTAQFSFEKSSYLANEEIKIINTTQGGSGSYAFEWDFGDGRKSTESEPVISYADNGAYKIRLDVRDGAGRYAMSHRLLTIEAEPLPEVGDMKIKWISGHTLGNIRSIQPAVGSDGGVYMTSDDHVARKFDAQTGSQLWEFDLWNAADGAAPAGNTHVTPSVDIDGTVYFGTGNTSGAVGRLYALNPNGTKKWVMAGDAQTGFWNKGNAATPRLHYITCPVGDGDYIYVGNAGGAGSVLAVDKKTGHRKGYAATSANDGGPNGGVTGGMVVSNGMVVWYGAKNGPFGISASALDGGGNVPYWQLANAKTKDTGNGTFAVGADGTIYGAVNFTSGSPTGACVFAMNPDGTEKWRTPIGNIGSLDQGGPVITADGRIVVTAKQTAGEANGGIYCVAPTGELLWSFGVSENVSGSAAIDQAGNIHFGTELGNYYIIKDQPSDDQLVLKKDLAAMIAEGDYSSSSEWSAGGGKIWSSPTIAPDGTIYIGVSNVANANASLLVALHDDAITGPALSPWPMRGKDCRHTCFAGGGSSVGPDVPVGSNTQLPLTWKMKEDMQALIDNPSKVWLCSHRGITKKGLEDGVAENSLEAIDYAVKAGAEIIEIDVRPTKDGELVLMHDATVDRTTNGTGKVSDLTYAEIKALKLKNADGKLTSSSVPTLKQAFERGKGKIYFNLDISDKLVPGDATNSLVTMAKLITDMGMTNQTVVYVGGKMSVVNHIKGSYPDLLYHPYVSSQSGIDSFKVLSGVKLMQLSTDQGIEGSVVRMITGARCLPFANTLNTHDNNILASGNYSGVDAMVNNGVRIIQTNYTELIGSYLKNKGLR